MEIETPSTTETLLKDLRSSNLDLQGKATTAMIICLRDGFRVALKSRCELRRLPLLHLAGDSLLAMLITIKVENEHLRLIS
jgi:hypothetical protein